MRRVLPSTIEVRVVERTPMVIARGGQRLYLLDEHGVVVDAFGPAHQEFDLPIVDGLVRQERGGPPVVDASRAGLTRRFFEAIRAAGAMGGISQVDVTDDRDVVVLLEGDTTLVRLGDEQFAERLRTYQDLASTLRDQLEAIDYVDMRFDSRVYVKSKGRLAAMPE
jgi:cell division septal protein FtsQ